MKCAVARFRKLKDDFGYINYQPPSVKIKEVWLLENLIQFTEEEATLHEKPDQLLGSRRCLCLKPCK